MKKALVFLICTGLAGAAAARTLYRIELRGQAPVVARDAPVTHGSVLVFHRQADGRLTGVPREDVVSVTPVSGSASTSTSTSRTARQSATRKATVKTVTTTAAPAASEPLSPGDTLVLGPTGGDGSIREAGAPGANAQPGGQPGATAPGTAGSPGSVGPNGVPGAATNAPGSVDPNLALQPPAATT
ncbi:MAG: hypothetical protein H7X85_09765, partial [Thermoanaerobaculia bacterium]|nr:hypothetical protein [Thermoanaerobaculia bacterium]